MLAHGGMMLTLRYYFLLAFLIVNCSGYTLPTLTLIGYPGSSIMVLAPGGMILTLRYYSSHCELVDCVKSMVFK